MDIIGYTDYTLDREGNVYSKKMKRYLKKRINNNGYYWTQTYINRVESHQIHRLLAIHYIPNPHNKDQVDHIDGNKLNNNINNLRWVSNIENGNNHQNKKTQYRDKPCNTTIRCILKNKSGWDFDKRYFGKRYRRWFNNKTDAICYKYIFLLRMKANHFK